MIRFIRDPQPPYTQFKAGMVRDLGSALEDIFLASGDAVATTLPSTLYQPDLTDTPPRPGGVSAEELFSDAQVAALQAAADPDDLAIYGTPARTRWPIGVQQQALLCEAVEASSTGLIYPQACAVVGIKAIALGTGTLTIHDDRTASDATRLRMSRAVAAMTAGSYYPMVADDGSALLFERGAFVTVPTGGLYLLDVVSDIRAYGIESGGLLCTAERLAASGRILGLSAVKSLKVIAPGSAGDLSVHEDHGATNAKRLRMPVTAFGSLAADQIINLAHRNCVRQFRNLYVTVPTSGIVLINRIPV